MLQAQLTFSMNSSPQLQDASGAAVSGAYWQPDEVVDLLHPIEATVAAVIQQFAVEDLDADESRSSFVSAVDGALIARHPQAALAPSTLRHALIGRVMRCQPRSGITGKVPPLQEKEMGVNSDLMEAVDE